MARAIVVLGHCLNEDGTAPSTLLSRVATAVARWERDEGALVVCTGGDTAGTGRSEASIMAGLLQERGLPTTARCVLEELSLNTVDNAVECVPILRAEAITAIELVTSEFHLPRASYFFEAVFEAYGLGSVRITPVPAPTPPPRRGDCGINGEPLATRIAGEVRFVSKYLEHMLDRFNSNPSIPIAPLPPARKERACAELDALLSASCVDEGL